MVLLSAVFAPPLVLFYIDAMVINLKCNSSHVTGQLKVFHATLRPPNELLTRAFWASAPASLSLSSLPHTQLSALLPHHSLSFLCLLSFPTPSISSCPPFCNIVGFGTTLTPVLTEMSPALLVEATGTFQDLITFWMLSIVPPTAFWWMYLV